MANNPALVDVLIIEDPEEIKRVGSPHGKAFLRLRSHDGTIVLDITLNIGGMIGGVAKGVAERLRYKW